MEKITNLSFVILGDNGVTVLDCSRTNGKSEFIKIAFIHTDRNVRFFESLDTNTITHIIYYAKTANPSVSESLPDSFVFNEPPIDIKELTE